MNKKSATKIINWGVQGDPWKPFWANTPEVVGTIANGKNKGMFIYVLMKNIISAQGRYILTKQGRTYHLGRINIKYLKTCKDMKIKLNRKHPLKQKGI